MKNLQTNLNLNLKIIKLSTTNLDDLIVKQFKFSNINCAIIYIKGMVNLDYVSKYVLEPAINYNNNVENAIEDFKTKVVSFPEIVDVTDFKTIREQLACGKAFVLFNGQNKALQLEVDYVKERTVAEPPTSAVLKGPRAGFVENYKTNISLIKNIISSPNLKVKKLKVGSKTNTEIAVMYLNDIANPKIVNKIINKIKEINIDGIIDSFYVAQFLEVHKESFFKQVGSSEKPDIVSAKILEGRIAVIVDGSPIVLTLPFILLEDLQNSEDYYSQHAHAKFIRVLRLFSILITTLLPGMYIAIQLYHYKTIPLNFLITIINTTTGLPLTPFAEILFVLILFEILYEASLRMPKYLGLALSVVGALILGDTAVKAGLISPPSVMIVAISGITLYTVPDQANQLSIIRFLNTLAGGILGFYGMILLNMFFIIYLNDFDSYGSPYIAPYAPRIPEDFKDAILKDDITNIKYRPLSIKNINHKKQRSKK